uniref:Uncharacterized protein n=2 Tax=Avena sativa TaxID=4498 RepID=A0ACD5TDQ7_AVESA
MSSAAARFATAADNASSEAQSLVMDMRKALNSMKSLAVDFERAGKPDKVKQLEEEVLELMASYEDCAHLAEAVKDVPGAYQLSDQATDFKKLIEAEVNKVKGTSRVSGDSQRLLRQFREAVWDVHHAGQPMPGDEQEDVVMTSTQSIILNIKCPITMKPVIELSNPVRCQDCRHIYDKDAIIDYIRRNKAPKCPVAGCPKVLPHVARINCDSYLLMEIEELRSSGPGATNASDVEDILDDEEDLVDDDEDGDN